MKKSLLVLLSLVLVLSSVSAFADSLIIGPGTGKDPVLLTSNTSFTVLDNPGNVQSDISTLLLFFSVPTNLVGQFSTVGANPTLNFIGSFTMTGSGCADVYTCAGNNFSVQTGLNFTGLNDSNSFKNYTGAAATNSLPVPTSYTIYLFSDGSIDHKQTVTFTGLSMPQGTYIAGGGKEDGGDQGFTAFTHAGLITTKTPEPGSIALLSAGLLGLGGLLKRRK
jgi:hypothetical protein